MRKFVLNLVVFVFLISLPVIVAVNNANGYTDPFYLRFTSSKQSNLILGASASAQGLQPQFFNNILQGNFYNYSFTNFHSPFGPIYLESIKKKLDDNQRNGTFIIFVTPLSICSITLDPNDSSNFRENKLCVGNTPFVNMDPNFIYLFENFKGQYYKLFYDKSKPREEKLFLHDDGWLEVSVPMDSISIRKRLDREIIRYRNEKLHNYKYSNVRFEYLLKTMEYLRGHGKVFLVRLPVHSEMLVLENELMSDFDERIQNISHLSNGYYNMTQMSDDFLYTDGFHLYKESGKLVSKRIAEWIKSD